MWGFPPESPYLHLLVTRSALVYRMWANLAESRVFVDEVVRSVLGIHFPIKWLKIYLRQTHTRTHRKYFNQQTRDKLCVPASWV